MGGTDYEKTTYGVLKGSIYSIADFAFFDCEERLARVLPFNAGDDACELLPGPKG